MSSGDLIPARMVNEYVYCPRLFYLEWVEARFADSDDTRLGQQVHRRVDRETGAAPLPDEGELRNARSLTLSSEALGVIAKLDIVEGDGETVVPIDYKKGDPQAGRHRVAQRPRCKCACRRWSSANTATGAITPRCTTRQPGNGCGSSSQQTEYRERETQSLKLAASQTGRARRCH